MTFNIIASIVLIYWLLQGARLTAITWAAPYATIWAVVQGFLTLLLIIPIIAVWH